MKSGVNEIEFYGKKAEVELKIVPTIYSGTCHLMQLKRLQVSNEALGSVLLVGYEKDLNPLDIPKG